MGDHDPAAIAGDAAADNVLGIDPDHPFLVTLLNAWPDLVYIKDTECRFVAANATTATVMGVKSAADMVGKTDFDFHPPHLAKQSYEAEREIIETGRPLIGNEECVTVQPGVWFWISSTKVPLRDADGRIIGIVGIGRDITDLREQEIRLRQSEARFRTVFDSVAEGLVTMDTDGTIEMVNSQAEQIFGYERAEMIGRNVTTLMPDTLSNARDGLAKGLAENGETRETGTVELIREIVGMRRDETTFPLELRVSTSHDGDKETLIAAVRDISHRKEAEAERQELERELRQAQKIESLGTLAGGIAHEINTPTQYVGDNLRFLGKVFPEILSLLQQYGELTAAVAERRVPTKLLAKINTAAEDADLAYLAEDIPSSISQALDGVKRIGEIVQAIKEFSYPETKEKQAVDINRAIATTATVTRNQWKYVAELDTDFDTELPLILCLPGELNQVVLNLIVNAAHAIEDAGRDEQGRITVRTRKNGDWAEISVSDTGTGIANNIRDKLFDPFFTTKEPGRGTGQGLAICHSIITKKHGGHISVESEEGKGSTFIIRLPLTTDVGSEAA